MVLKPMATDAKEPTFSMGDDTPFAAVATRPRPVFNFLKQRFAQVSNPPIDHLRERLVMSLRTCLGRAPSAAHRGPRGRGAARAADVLPVPRRDRRTSSTRTAASFRAEALDATFAVADGPGGLATRRRGSSRRSARRGRARRGHPRRLRRGHRTRPRADPVAARRSARCTTALVVAGARRTRRSSSTPVTRATRTRSRASSATAPTRSARGSRRARWRRWPTTASSVRCTSAEAQAKLQAAIEDGVLKILSKMGISTVDGYRGAQIFEVLGLGPEVVERACAARRRWSAASASPRSAPTSSRATRQRSARAPRSTSPGFIRFRKRGGEYHGNNPEVISALQSSVGLVDRADDEDGDGEEPKRAGARRRRQVRRVPRRSGRGPGQVIFFEGDQAEPVPPADPADLRAAHLLQTRDHRAARRAVRAVPRARRERGR